MFTQKELKDAIAVCRGQLEELGYKAPQVAFKTSNRMTRALGSHKFNYNRMTGEAFNHTITLSTDLTPEIMPNTLMHELIHSIYPLDKHGYYFQKLANLVNTKYGYWITTYASGKSKEVIQEVRQAKMVKIACANCGTESLLKPSSKTLYSALTGKCVCNRCKSTEFKRV
jgi:hypothetical protein